jgi:YidC/Oxa1 family membrane protein insertase
MDRNTFLALLLTGLLMMIWMVWFSPVPPPPSPDQLILPADSQVVNVPLPDQPTEQPEVVTFSDSTFLSALQGNARTITVQTDYYTASFSSKGGTLTSLTLNDYFTYDLKTPVQLVDTSSQGALSMVFTTLDSRLVDSRDLFFDVDQTRDFIDARTQPAQLTFTATLGQGMIEQVYTFNPGSFQIDLEITQTRAETFSTPDGYELTWIGGVPFAERYPKQEALSANASVRTGGGVESISLSSDPTERELYGGAIDWVAVKNAFFTVVMIPSSPTKGAELEGHRVGEPEDPNYSEAYTARLAMHRPSSESDLFRLYMGPVDNREFKPYGLDLYQMVDYGFGQSISRPIARYVVMPVFHAFSNFIPNFGLIIILFAFLIKLILYPLTKSSYKSMAVMRTLQPKMEEIKQKYGDDPQKQQQAMMRLYKESGANPLGGCLPMFFQLPILYALFRFFPSAIEIRQEGFLWATDLSSPDILVELPFNIPFYGDHVAGFVLLMTIAMVIQMKIQGTTGTGAQANQMKVFMYIMPVMLLVFFNNFAAGLSLYYLIYNILTAIQQKLINRTLEAQGIDTKGGSGKGADSKSSKSKLLQTKASSNGQSPKNQNRPSKARR